MALTSAIALPLSRAPAIAEWFMMSPRFIKLCEDAEHCFHRARIIWTVKSWERNTQPRNILNGMSFITFWCLAMPVICWCFSDINSLSGIWIMAFTATYLIEYPRLQCNVISLIYDPRSFSDKFLYCFLANNNLRH